MKNSFERRGPVIAIRLDAANGDQVEALIDAADHEVAAAFPGRWRTAKKRTTSSLYVEGTYQSEIGKWTTTSLHRWLTKPEVGLEVHHRNENPLDNRRENLEVLTRAEHNRKRSNRQPMNADLIDTRVAAAREFVARFGGYRDVFLNRKSSRWQARIVAGNQRIYLGSFPTRGEADGVIDRVMA